MNLKEAFPYETWHDMFYKSQSQLDEKGYTVEDIIDIIIEEDNIVIPKYMIVNGVPDYKEFAIYLSTFGWAWVMNKIDWHCRRKHWERNKK